jgi:hypothetical protein
MQDLEELRKKLEAPFTRKVNGREIPCIKWLPKTVVGPNKDKFICIPFLDKNMVTQRLDDVFGIDGWQDKPMLQADGTVFNELSVLINSEWITRGDVGTKSQVEKEKGAATDSLKRAAVKFGIGRYLSELPATFCPAKVGSNGKHSPVDDKGRPLYGNNLSNYINGQSIGQGLLYQLLKEIPSLWKRDDVKKLWEDLK